MRHRRDAVAHAHVRVGEREVDRRDQVGERALALDQERGGDVLRARADVDGRRLDAQAGRVALAHPAIELEERNALAVDRDLHAGDAGREPEELTVRARVHVELEDVLAVRREVVGHRDAAARAEGGALDVADLRDGLRDLVDGRGRRGVDVPDRVPAHLGRGPHVALEQRGREDLRVRDVVEVVAERLGRQVGGRVDPDAEELLDRGLVLRPVETLEGAAARIRVPAGDLVEAVLEAPGEQGERVLRRTAHAGGRHHAGPQLVDHPLGDLGGGLRSGRVEALQGEVAAQTALVVAADAVLLDHAVEVGRRDVRGGCGPRGGRMQERAGGLRHPRSPCGVRGVGRRSARDAEKHEAGREKRGLGGVHGANMPGDPQGGQRFRRRFRVGSRPFLDRTTTGRAVLAGSRLPPGRPPSGTCRRSGRRARKPA